jgi:hypothetical protein
MAYLVWVGNKNQLIGADGAVNHIQIHPPIAIVIASSNTGSIG